VTALDERPNPARRLLPIQEGGVAVSTPTNTTPSTEVATRQPKKVAVHVGVPLKGLDEAYRLSQALAMAGLMPKDLRGKPSDVLAILLYGQEVGLAPMQAIQGIYVVNSRPTLAAQTWLALLRRAGHRAYVPCKTCDGAGEEHMPGRAHADHRYDPDHDERRCRMTIVRGDTGAMHTEKFDLDDAKTAGLAHKDIWKAHPRRMTLARAVSNCARFICPEVAMGFYSEGEEFDDVEDIAPGVFHVADPTPGAAASEDSAPIDEAEIVAPESAREEVSRIAEEFNFAEQPSDRARETNVCTECNQTGHYDDEHDPEFGSQGTIDGAP
jgi:hypothetical protein